MSSRSEFGGINEGYILELYERFRENPESVDPATRAAFERAAPSFEAEPGPLRGTRPTYGEAEQPGPLRGARPTYGEAEQPGPLRGTRPTYGEGGQLQKIVGAVNLAESIRKYGHLGARLDPLGSPAWGDPSLAPESHNISEADLRTLPASLIGGPAAEGKPTAWEAIEALRGPGPSLPLPIAHPEGGEGPCL